MAYTFNVFTGRLDYFQAAAAAVSFSDNETPSGSIDSSNVTFTLANAPSPAGSLNLVLNGQPQLQGTDYTLSSATITFSIAPETDMWLRAWYRF